ncbi:hypothetical protein M422DRAFT_34811 [Sphaerobolus stellatus SS14]|uniref:Uncharacterized protein n=1 Tax=Sphaerobolus stellatus (strain SS14) TaxID=990650 RepID=A0A0C9VCN1_SPHS4|nr:hypothetical protein M422DRAFT_34811 [Sphaerobolus stellatus SS14]
MSYYPPELPNPFPIESDRTLTGNRTQYMAVPQGGDTFSAPLSSGSDWPQPQTPGMEKTTSLTPPPSHLAYKPPTQAWNPIPLRRWFAVTLLTIMVLVAIALEVALHFSRVKTGWGVTGVFAATTGIFHFIYTLPPVAAAMVIVALWAWTDVDIKRLQPYIDLAYGNAPAKSTLLLDYSTKHPGITAYFAIKRNHWLVALSSILVLVGLAVQPLAASLFTVRNTWWNGPDLNVTIFDQPTQFTGLNMTVFSTAAGFVQANVLYNATIPNFVGRSLAVTRLAVPTDRISNGTMFAPTTAFKSAGNCVAADTVDSPSAANGQSLIATSTVNDSSCQLSVAIAETPALQFGVTTANCTGDDSLLQMVHNVVFWIYDDVNGTQNALTSAVFCRPTVQLLDVTASIAFSNGQFLTAAVIGPSDKVLNVTDPNSSLGGRPLNGLSFNDTAADVFDASRELATTIGLSSAIIQNATATPGGLEGRMQDKSIVRLTESAYSLYLSLIAKQIYFEPVSGQFQEVTTKSFIARLFMVDVTVHILVVVLIFFAILGSYIHIQHRKLRDRVILPLQPGTLASAAAFTARSNVSDLLDAKFDDKQLQEVLRHKRFKMDRETGQIVLDADGVDEDDVGGANVRRRRTLVDFMGRNPQRQSTM